MINAELSADISFIAFVVFTLLVVVGALSTLIRAIRYSHAGQKWPRLLIRDLVWIGGLGLDFMLILGVRFLGIGPALRDNVLWVLLTSGIAIAAVAVFVYYELAVIERPNSRNGRR